MAHCRPASTAHAPENPSAGADPGVAPRGQRLHFVGIGGCGMSGLARMAAAHGAVCTGSDRQRSAGTDRLQAAGITVTLEPSAHTLPDTLDQLVISAAIKPDHPEVVEATRRGVAVTKYAQMLGRLMARQVGVAIAGTHGKSTTTSLLAHILIQAGLDPSFIVGANCAQIGGGWRVSEKDHRAPALLLAEACEYDRSFHQLWPMHAVILNVEADHLDLYASLDEIVEAFAIFARQVPDANRGGSLLVNHEMGPRLAITAGLDCAVETIGFAPQADWQVRITDHGEVSLIHHGEGVAQWTAPLPGEHMAYNAAAAAVTAHRLGGSWGQIAAAIEGFQGLDRRMQVIGQAVLSLAAGPPPPSCGLGPAGGWPPPATPAALIIDDYGHHPTEIDTTLRALRRHYRPDRLICVFQPHQHSRTRFLMVQFATSFAAADRVIVPDIYFVRDSQQERQAVTAVDLVAAIQAGGTAAAGPTHARHIADLDAIVEHLRQVIEPGDLVVTMGAGDVWKVAHALVND